MEDNKVSGLYNVQQESEEKSSFDFKTLYTIFILNWKWFVLSMIICIGSAIIYLRYATPQYMTSAKILIKDDNKRGRNNIDPLMSLDNLGIVSSTMGIENEIEIIKSFAIAQQAVKELKLYTTYTREGRVHDQLIYKDQPITVDMDLGHLENLTEPIDLTITRNGSSYNITGTYYYTAKNDPSKSLLYEINKNISSLPATINTHVGALTFNATDMTPMSDGTTMDVQIVSPREAAFKYSEAMSVEQLSKTTTIMQLNLTDEIPERGIDFLRQIAVCYNQQANEDKNEVAMRTEEFINGRLEKINSELGDTESKLEEYKKRNRMVELTLNAGQAVQNQDEFSQKLVEANTQVELLKSISEYMDKPENKYQTLPSNIGLSDPVTTELISQYNNIVLTRNGLMHSASENSPIVTPLTAQLDNLSNSIRRAIQQARRDMEIKRNSVAQQYGKYSGQISSTPEQERVLSEIGRQQTVKSGLYLTLLQKREENSISLASTADKGKLIDDPQFMGKVSPKSSMVIAIAFVIALAIPSLVFFLIRFFRYRIEGHDDVETLTSLPIIADVAVASSSSKTKADIVVHENQNNQMEEIFRSMRTNLQFMLGEDQKTVMFTSFTSGEGKTFNAANLAVSFALLDKKVVIVGLDIRKPRLCELFEIDDYHHGITPLLAKSDPTPEDVHSQILESGVNKNLFILPAGPIPPNPAELVSRKSLDKVFEILKKDFDYIIVDTPPIGLVTDSQNIGRIADITIYVCRADYTPKSAFELVNKLNEEKRLPEMCIIINGIDMSKKKYGYYYGYHKYGKYGNYKSYNSYGTYSNSHYGNKNDTSVKL